VSEGKLQKLLEELRQEAVKEINTEGKFVHELGRNELLKLKVEEMKADFPKIVLGAEVNAAETILEVMKWREKWLGAKEKT